MLYCTILYYSVTVLYDDMFYLFYCPMLYLRFSRMGSSRWGLQAMMNRAYGESLGFKVGASRIINTTLGLPMNIFA